MGLPTIDLMQPTQVPRPVHHAGWIYEGKYDGWRMVAYKDGDRVRSVSSELKTAEEQVAWLMQEWEELSVELSAHE